MNQFQNRYITTLYDKIWLALLVIGLTLVAIAGIGWFIERWGDGLYLMLVGVLVIISSMLPAKLGENDQGFS
jgi:hypothetical protein